MSEDRIRFEPRSPLARGLRYRAEFRAPGAAPLISYFGLRADPTPPSTTVLPGFPSAEVLPENPRKFYVQFWAPMNRGRTEEQVRVRAAVGRVIELPFPELAEEGWNPAMMRLPLRIDPGRIKRGVKPRVDVGPVFEAGKTYSRTSGEAGRDAEDRPRRTGFEKRFRVGPADRSGPDPARGTFTAPTAGTCAPLVVAFGEPLDHPLASRMIRVMRADGTELDGEVKPGARVATGSWCPGRSRTSRATTGQGVRRGWG